ncbi:hypothetical protein [uncultured Corynebacterium sp.]|uniref:hypothetical protein n=1 Tax=uncultured Corynebacterium sp. TaxID=159447 RepID=UPI00288B369A|nr:hypothetical protein [uncultured Corynebacterium sp.]
MWLVKNIGNFLTVTMSSTSNRAYSPIRVVPQSTAIIPLGALLLRFSTKMMRYELELVQGTPVTEPEVDSLPNAEFTRNTFEPNYEQRRVLEALERPLLKDPSAVPRVVIPSTKELAEESTSATPTSASSLRAAWGACTTRAKRTWNAT